MNSYYKTKTKEGRRQWFNNLSAEDKAKVYEKRKNRKRIYKDIPKFKPVTKENKDKWINRILTKNKWLKRKNGHFIRVDTIEPPILFEDQKHLESIKSEI